jgi:putative spermidine/putrescine transport system permease protein
MTTRKSLAWLNLPAVAILGVVFVFPLFVLGRMAFNRTQSGGAMEEAWTLDTFHEAAADDFTFEITWNSLELSLLTASLAVLLAYPVSLFLFRSESRWRGILAIAAVMPLLVNGVVRVFGWMVVLGDRGLINNTLIALGITSEPIRLIYNWIGVVIGLTESLMPYAILALLAGFGRLDRSLEEAAMSLGARPWRTFMRITLPLSLPAIVLAWLLAFMLAMSAFVTPKLLGGGRVFTLATEIYDQAMVSLNWPLGAVLSLYMLVLLLLFIGAYGALTRRMGA